MQTYGDLATEFVSGALQLWRAAQEDLTGAAQARVTRIATRQQLDGWLQAKVREHREFDSPQSALKAEVNDLLDRIRGLERQLAAKREQLSVVEGEAEKLSQEISKARAEIARTERELERDAEAIASKKVALSGAHSRLVEARLSALRAYCKEVFEGLQRTSTEIDASRRFEELRAEFANCCQSDPEVLRLNDERTELRHLLEASHVQSLRDLLTETLRTVEGAIEAKFPGFLSGPPPFEDEEVVEIFYWYEAGDDVTSVLLPLPSSCWHSPPETLADPRGEFLCRVVWSFVGAIGNQVPTIECDKELVRLELHGDQSQRISDALIELPLGSSRKVTFLPMSLPTELKEALE